MEINPTKNGVSVKIEAGIFGTFSFIGEVETDEDGNLCGSSSPVYRNGEYFLPWHVTAALTSNGSSDNWVARNEAGTVVKELLAMKSIYQQRPWYKVIGYANQLTGACVY